MRLTPRAARDAIDGPGETSDGHVHLLARVRALPDKGAANAALEKLVADSFKLPRKSVEIVSGATSRLKTVRISGAPETLADRLQQTVLAGSGKTRG